MDIKFVEAQKESIQEILSMMKSFYKINSYHFEKAASEKSLKELLSTNALGRLWMIHLNGKIIRYLILTFGFSLEDNGRDAFIDELFIKEEFRNKGVGKLTMEFIELQAKKLGVNAIHLEVENRNEAGKQLFFKQGYSGNDRMLLTKKLD